MKKCTNCNQDFKKTGSLIGKNGICGKCIDLYLCQICENLTSKCEFGHCEECCNCEGSNV